MNYTTIISSINKKDFRPIYFLIGDEPYYIDKLTTIFANEVLTLEEKEFNQVVLYGKDVSIEQIILEAKQFPFNSSKRVVIIKEAQHIKNLNKIITYIEKPQESTMLILCLKNKSIDKRTVFGKKVYSKCVVFESKKLYDNNIPKWILEYVNNKGQKISHEAIAVLSNNIDNDLSKISNELEKLMLLTTKEKEISRELIQKHIGINKDYNVFELQNALGKKDILKSNKIINHFISNPKNHNVIAIISSIFIFFQKIILYKSLNDSDRRNAAKILQVHPFFLEQYKKSANKYTKKQLLNIFFVLKEYDLKSKGVNKATSNGLLKELIYKILH